MKVFKLFSQILSLLGIMMIFALSGWGDTGTNDSCANAETVSALNNIATTQNVNVSGALTQSSDQQDFYKFVIGANGTLNINATLTGNSGLFYVGNSCSGTTCGTQYYNGNSNASSHQTGTFNVSSGTTVYMEVTKNKTLTYSLNVGFTLNQPPVVSPSTMTTTIVDGTANGTAVMDVNATDSDSSNTLTYSITAGNTGNTFSIDSATGIITVANSGNLNHLVTPSYTLTVTVSDGQGGTATGTVTVNVTAPSANLSITKSANNTSPAVGDTVVFTLTGTNNGPSASQFKITDILPSGLSYVSATATPTTNFSCSQSGGTITCNGTNSFSSGQSATVTINATVTGSAGTAIINTAQIVSNNNVSDPTTSNNSASVTIVPTNATIFTVNRDFALRNSINSRGDVKAIGNTILCKSSNGTSSGTCTAPGNTEANNDFYAIYNDIDADPGTTSSSSADLALPSGSKILWAGLYWQGQFPSGFSTDKNTAKTVKLKIPGASAYTSVTASQLDYDSGTNGYQGFADVTSLLNINNPNGTYYVGNVLTTLGSNAYGAWVLNIIYQDNTDTLKNITAYDGFKAIFQSSSTQTVNVSGFRTPLSGPIASTFFIFGAEGDAAYTGEGLQIKNASGNFIDISNTLNPSNNQFNSNITYKNAYVTTRNPNWQNTAGVDIDTYDISNILGNNQTSTQIKLIGGGNDRYFVGVFGFATQIYSPTIGNFDKNATVTYGSNQLCHGNKDLRGATIHYETSFSNTGTEAASTVKVYDDFQSNGILNYLDMTQTTTPTAQLLSGTAATTITCDKNATAVYCNFDRININTKYKISFDVKVKSSLTLPNDVTLSNTANAHYYNASTGEEITQIASSNMQMAGGLCAVIPVADYRLDECLWGGSTYDVLDYSGNALNGIAVNNPVSTYAQNCMGGQFKGASTNTNITVPNNSLLNLSNALSVSVWVNPSSYPTSDLRTILSKDTNYEFHLNTNGQVFWWWGNGSFTGTTPLPLNTWSHIAITYQSGTQKIYVNGIEDASATYTGTLPQNTNPLYIGVDYNYPSRTFEGMIDEVKVFDRALNATEVATIYTNEAAHNNFDGSLRVCYNCTLPATPANTFDAWDSFRSIADRKISTKIVSKPFDLTVASLNSAKTAYQDFNGTACAQIVDGAGTALSPWSKFLFSSSHSATGTFSLARAIGGNDSAGILLMWKKDASILTSCDALTDTNTSLATDRFAVRPASFAVSSPSAVAGTNFNITFTAPVYGSATGSANYNETAGSTFSVTFAEHNTNCPMGTFTPLPSSFTYVNGSNTLTTRYSEVGLIDLNITDTTLPCASRYAKVDCDDTDVSGFYSALNDLPIGLTQMQIPVRLDHFDVNATLANFSTGTFTYLTNNDLNISAQLSLTLNAKNGEGGTTKNYDKGCYAKSTTITLPHSAVPNPLTKIYYAESVTAVQSNVLKSADITLSPGSSVFTQGVASLALSFNFDRDRASPLNPFNFSFTNATVTDHDATGAAIPLGTANFVYGRVHAYDIATNVSPVNVPVEFEVYSSVSGGFVNGKPQNVLYWYRNTDHTTAAEGNVIRGGFTAGTTDPAINTAAAPNNGIQILGVTSVIDQTVHLDISPWLWYSPKYDYSYGGSCAQHPCFQYDYTDNASGVKGVTTGTFQGSDFQMAPAQNITNKGVKLFR